MMIMKRSVSALSLGWDVRLGYLIQLRTPFRVEKGWEELVAKTTNWLILETTLNYEERREKG
jgi:hypothetical protein